MKSMMLLNAAVISFVLLAPAESLAQRGTGGWGPGQMYARMYDPATVESLSGKVVSVDEFNPRKDMYTGIHLMLKTANETISVHLGPSWFLERQDVQIAPNDEIGVKGSRIAFEGKPALIAAQITKGEEVLTLRDAKGYPAWSAWRRRQW